MSSIKGNKKVAKNRGYSWNKKLIEGRIDAELHPTKLKLGRVRRLVSQQKIAQNLGISLATYGAIERSRRCATQKTASSISELLKFPLSELFRTKDGKYIAIK